MVDNQVEDFVGKVLDPDQFSFESLKYQQTLILQHMRIQRTAAGCLGGSPYEQRKKVNELYGAVVEMCVNLKITADKEYNKIIKPFLKTNIWDKKFEKEKNLIGLFQYVMQIHELNIREYSKFGLKPARKSRLWMATREDVIEDIKENLRELGEDV